MYEKPALKRFGSLRELTMLGMGADGDGGIQAWGYTIADGCNWVPSGTCGGRS